MNQIAAFPSPAAPPNAAGAVAHAGHAAAPDEGFASVLAQLQALIGNPGASAATIDGALAQFQTLLGTTAIESDPTLGANPSVQTNGTADTPVELKNLFDLLGLIASPTTGEMPGAGAADATTASPNTTLAAQLAAVQLALQNVQAQPNAQAPSGEKAPSVNIVSEQSVAAAAVPIAQFGLRGTLAQSAQQPNEPAGKNQAPAPQATTAAAVAAALTTIQGKQDANGPQPQNITKASAAPKRATNAPGTETAAPAQQQAQSPKAPDSAAGSTAPAVGTESSTTQHAPADKPAATNTQPAQTPAGAPAAVLANATSAQQFNVTVAATPQAVPLEALAVHIARKFEGGSSQFEIRLHPAELGQLDISLSVADDGRVQAVLRAERPETLDMLQRDARALEQQLRQAGLDVGSNALSFSLSKGNDGRQAPFTGWPAFADANDIAGTAKEEVASKYVAVRVRDGIDIRV